jgi:NAD+ kinase
VPPHHKPLKNIALFCHQPQLYHATCLEIMQLLTQNKKNIILESTTAQTLTHPNATILPKTQLGQQADLLMVIGGDGSMLQAARFAAPQNLPLLGINKGKLGFLADIKPDQHQQVLDVLNGTYFEEKRMLLQTMITHPDKDTHKKMGLALNEVLFSRGASIQIQTFDVFINKRFVCRQHADGFVVSTPTGSTAYALSAGGPILHPDLQALCLVAICPHTLNARPLVIDNRSEIELVPYHNTTQSPPILSCDAHNQTPILVKEHIVIKRYPKPIRLIHPLNYHYYATLTEKLHWERKPHAQTTITH